MTRNYVNTRLKIFPSLCRLKGCKVKLWGWSKLSGTQTRAACRWFKFGRMAEFFVNSPSLKAGNFAILWPTETQRSWTVVNSRPAEGQPRPKVTIRAQAYRLQHELQIFPTDFEGTDFRPFKGNVAAQIAVFSHRIRRSKLKVPQR